MTTYIPSLTLPFIAFEKPAVSILLPLALGNAVGYYTRRKKTFIFPSRLIMPHSLTPPIFVSHSRHQRKIQGAQAATCESACICICSHVDRSLWRNGICRLACMEHRSRLHQSHDCFIGKGTLRARHRHLSNAQTAAVPFPNTASIQQGATLYTVQLGLNLAWMPLFFGLERPIEASMDVVALLGTTSYLAYVWSQFDQVAATIMVPYLCWLTFASYLSVSLASDITPRGRC
jgi:benzodiazapine receptor